MKYALSRYIEFHRIHPWHGSVPHFPLPFDGKEPLDLRE
jgi:hypothetical protein